MCEETTTAKFPGSVKKTLHLEMIGSFDESEHLSRVLSRSRSHAYDAIAINEDVSHRDDADDFSWSHIAIAMQVIAAIAVPLFM